MSDPEMDRMGMSDLVSPISMSSIFWGTPKLYPWMAGVMMSVWKDGGWTVLVTPNGAGKTSTCVANIGLSFMAAHPGSIVVSTAGAFRQIEDQLWPVLRAKLGKYPQWKVNEGYIEAPRHRGLPPSTWTAFSASDPGKAEGYHSREYVDSDGKQIKAPLLYIIDEAKSVDKGIFEAMYRCDPGHVLVCSTPGEDVGPFYELVDRKPEGWTVFEVTWSDCDHLLVGEERKRRERMIREMGENNPFVQSFIFGKFTRTGGNFLFDDMAKIRHAMSGQVLVTRTDKSAAVDVSGGGDEQVFAFREGNYCQVIEAFKERDTYTLGTKLIERFNQYRLRPEEIVIDAGGLGQPIIDTLEHRGFYGIRRYHFNGKPRDSLRYRDRGTEDHFYLRTLIMQQAVSIEQDKVLVEQMRRRRYKNPDRLELEDKETGRKRGEGSPDRLDCMVMLFSDYVSRSLYEKADTSGNLKTYTPVDDAEIRSGHHGMRFDS
jgi:hypothetical protein